MTHPTPVLTVAALATRWQCSRRAVLDKIHRGELVAFKIGRAYRIGLAVVEQYEQAGAAA